MYIYIYIYLSLYATNYIRLSYHSHKFKFIELLVILTWKSGWRSRSAWPQLMASWHCRGHLNSFSAMDFYSPQPQELQLLLSLARLAVQARPDMAWSFIFVLRHVWYCTYFYGWQILQPILLPHSSDLHLICFPCSPCSTFIYTYMLHL